MRIKLLKNTLLVIGLLLGLPALILGEDSTVQAIPLSEQGRWLVLNYAKIPSNSVSFSERGMTIEIARSASPVVYPLNPQYLQKIAFDIEINGAIKLNESIQGSVNNDDFVFRLGVVYEGRKTLNFIQRKLAASWLRQLYALAPPDSGVEKIEFFNVFDDERIKGQKRQHPLSELIYENFLFENPADGRVSATIDVDPDKRVLAIWISADGDDTQSSFSVIVKRISLIAR